jgi:hypothetical protein
LTEKGLALTPVLVELANWSDRHLRDIHPTIVNGEAMEFLRNDQAAFAKVLLTKYREKLATTMYKQIEFLLKIMTRELILFVR